MAQMIYAFNTKRLYTVKGQRIAWTVLKSGNVGMYDVDRFILYILSFKHTEVNDRLVLMAYDGHWIAPFDYEEHCEFEALREQLYNAASAL